MSACAFTPPMADPVVRTLHGGAGSNPLVHQGGGRGPEVTGALVTKPLFCGPGADPGLGRQYRRRLVHRRLCPSLVAGTTVGMLRLCQLKRVCPVKRTSFGENQDQQRGCDLLDVSDFLGNVLRFDKSDLNGQQPKNARSTWPTGPGSTGVDRLELMQHVSFSALELRSQKGIVRTGLLAVLLGARS